MMLQQQLNYTKYLLVTGLFLLQCFRLYDYYTIACKTWPSYNVLTSYNMQRLQDKLLSVEPINDHSS